MAKDDLVKKNRFYYDYQELHSGLYLNQCSGQEIFSNQKTSLINVSHSEMPLQAHGLPLPLCHSWWMVSSYLPRLELSYWPDTGCCSEGLLTFRHWWWWWWWSSWISESTLLFSLHLLSPLLLLKTVLPVLSNTVKKCAAFPQTNPNYVYIYPN